MTTAVASWANQLSPEQEQALKRAFAEAWLRYPSDPSAAAQSVCANMAISYRMAMDWVFDPFVRECQEELIKQRGEDFYLPNRTLLVRRIMEIGEDKSHSPKDRLAAYRLVAELRNFMPKPEQNTNIQVNNNRVMIVKDHGTEAEWREKMAAQQAKLVEDAALDV